MHREVGIDLFEGVYYWTIGGKGNWLTDADGNKIPVAGKDGSKPQMAVDADGYWTVDGVRIKDAAGNDVKAAGSNGKDGDSFFRIGDGRRREVTFTLTDGTTIIIPKASAAGFAFVFPTQLPKGGTDVDNYYLFAFGEEKILAYTGDITTADLMSIPQGWAARIDPDKKTVTVTAPAFAGSYYTEGILSLVGIDGKGKTQLASARICAVDYSDPEGTFVLNEGNMSSDNGSVIYITANGRLINYAYWRMNGSELGNVGQDMFIADGKAYIISQNGGNDGILVEADARTLKRTGKFGKSDLPDFPCRRHVARNRPDGLYPRQCRRIQTRSRYESAQLHRRFARCIEKPHGGRRQQSVRSCGQIYPGLGKRGRGRNDRDGWHGDRCRQIR